MTKKKHDPVNHPTWYNQHPSGIECIEMTKYFTFLLGNSLKYVWRCRHSGKFKQDLNKALFYAELHKKEHEVLFCSMSPKIHVTERFRLVRDAETKKQWDNVFRRFMVCYDDPWDKFSISLLIRAIKVVRDKGIR